MSRSFEVKNGQLQPAHRFEREQVVKELQRVKRKAPARSNGERPKKDYGSGASQAASARKK
jgi:hypothetical protein